MSQPAWAVAARRRAGAAASARILTSRHELYTPRPAGPRLACPKAHTRRSVNTQKFAGSISVAIREHGCTSNARHPLREVGRWRHYPARGWVVAPLPRYIRWRDRHRWDGGDRRDARGRTRTGPDGACPRRRSAAGRRRTRAGPSASWAGSGVLGAFRGPAIALKTLPIRGNTSPGGRMSAAKGAAVDGEIA